MVYKQQELVRSGVLCACGCGEETYLAPKKGDGYAAGEPRKYLRGHATRGKTGDEAARFSGKHEALTASKYTSLDGLCACGCGQTTKVAPHNDYIYGILKGEHYQFVRGHSSRVRDGSLDERIPRHISRRRKRRLRVLLAGGSYAPSDVEALYSQQEGLCYYCGVDLNAVFHVDHRLPLARGGTNSPENLALTCALCNLRKWIYTEDEFRSGNQLPTALTDLTDVQRASIEARVRAVLSPEVAEAAFALLNEACGRRKHGRWAMEHDACRGCGTIERPHCAFGLCKRCYRHRSTLTS